MTQSDEFGSKWSWGAFFFGPLWYFFHGLILEGLIIAAVILVCVIFLDAFGLIGALIGAFYVASLTCYEMYHSSPVTMQIFPQSYKSGAIGGRYSFNSLFPTIERAIACVSYNALEWHAPIKICSHCRQNWGQQYHDKICSHDVSKLR